jgi:hypothetical protein
MKGETDDQNETYEEALRLRANASPKNVLQDNKELIKSMS